MNRPEGISPEAWADAADPAKRILAGEDFSTIEAFERVLFAAQCTISRAIQSSVEAERAKIEADVAAINSPSEYSNSWHLGFRAGREAAVEAIRKGA